MMDDPDSPSIPNSPPPKRMATESQRKKATILPVVIMIILGSILLGYLYYEYFRATETFVDVLETQVEIKEVDESIHIVKIETNQRKMDLLDSPRSDSDPISPAIRIKVYRGSHVLTYDAYKDYTGSGTYNILVGFRDVPEGGEILTCTVWVFSGRQGSFADDQETTKVVWSEGNMVKVLKATVNVEGEYPTASDANIVDIDVSQEPNEQRVSNSGSFYSGVYGFVEKNGVFVSFISCKHYERGGNYTLLIGLLFEPELYEELTIVIEIWGRNGEWLEGYYIAPIDTLTTTYTWGG
jgi:hypothetical protein